MPRITHVKDTRLGIDYGYLFDIQNQEELLDYVEKVRSAHIQEGVRDVLKCMNGKGHITTSYGLILDMRMRIGEGMVQATSTIEAQIMSTMQRVLSENGRLLVNTNGGYFSSHKNLEYIDTYEVKKYILPGAVVSVTQWPDGEHFYAKVGNEEVEMWGKRKWDTRKEALHAALAFQQKEK
jgi:hypothetical protein